jgi:hypothetical protein
MAIRFFCENMSHANRKDAKKGKILIIDARPARNAIQVFPRPSGERDRVRGNRRRTHGKMRKVGVERMRV